MFCEQCGKRAASVIMKQTVNGNVIERHLCSICATQNHNLGYAFEQDPLAIHQLLSNWFPNQKASANPVKKEVAVCPNCGFTFTKFMETGKFGCSTCYDTFENQLDNIFKRLHNGNFVHEGKIPSAYGSTLKIKKEIEELRKQMQVSIADEDFEEAAKLRDEVKALALQLEGGEAGGR